MLKLGLDILLSNHLSILDNQRVGIMTNPSGVTFDLTLNLTALLSKINITAIFAPEHGFRAISREGEKFNTYTDEKTGIAVYSLYGKTHKPTLEMMENIDILIFDIQDAGVRFYTFISTLLELMQSCREYGKTILILDRPNPINGNSVEGNILDMNLRSFVGSSPIPIRYGLTLGELARFYNDHFELNMKEEILCYQPAEKKNANLKIVLMDNWQRNYYYDQTGLEWIPPSPNFATPDTTIVFPGACFIEGINCSEGRGTVRPFEWIGAPYIDAEQLSEQLNSYQLPGVYFRSNYFIPWYSKHKETVCSGVQIHVLNRDEFRPTEMGLYLLKAIHDLYPKDFLWIKFEKYFIDHLLGSNQVRLAIDAGQSIESSIIQWRADANHFRKLKSKYHLY